MTEKVIKKDGSIEPFDVSKIRAKLEKATAGTKVSPLEIEALLKFTKPTYKTSEIQSMILEQVKNKISVDAPEYNLIAGRIAMDNLYREIWKLTRISPENWEEMIDYLVRNGYYKKQVKEYLHKLDDKTKQKITKIITTKNHDFSMMFSQVEILKSKYLVKNRKGFLEYPFVSDIANALLLSKGESELFLKMFEAIHFQYISLATPFKRNLRRPNGNTGSCFIGETDDSLASIFKSYTDIAFISKHGGGLGWYFGKLRPGGTYTENIVQSNKITKWVKIVNDIIVAVNQAGQRKGAITIALDWWHMDIFEFLAVKSELEGDLRDKAFDIFPQVVVDRYFVDAVLQNKEVYLFNHFEFKQKTGIDITELVDDELYQAIEQAQQMAADGEISGQKVSAKELWKKMLWVWVEIGDFYITHKDNLNKSNYLKQKIGVTKNANLCVAPETQILTNKGYKTIADLEGQKVNIWNGEEWSEVEVMKTGENQKLIKIETTAGTIECTEYHKFYVQEGFSNNGKIIEKRAHELQIGDRLIKFSLPLIEGHKNLPLAYENGFYSGDGYQAQYRKHIFLYGEKQKLLPHFRDIDRVYYDKQYNRILIKYHNKKLLDKFFVPSAEYTIQSRLEWLAGILDSDGTLVKNGETQAIQISSTNYKFLHQILLMLQTFGVASKLTKSRIEGDYLLPTNNGTDNKQFYHCKTVYRLLIGETGIQTLLNLGLTTFRLKPKLRTPNRNAEHFIKVISISDEGRYDDTYCFTEYKRHMGMFNGILTGQCVESFSLTKVPTQWEEKVENEQRTTTKTNGLYHSCNLISINVAKFAKDESKLPEICELAVRMLDTSIDEGTAPVAEAARSSELLRNIGVGVVGLADYMAWKKVTYDTEEGQTIGEALIERLSYHCVKASIKLAQEKGSYPLKPIADYSKLFGEDPVKLTKESLNGFDWVAVQKEIQEKGIRNFLLTAIAPNTTTGIMMGVTASYLPVYNKEMSQVLGDTVVPILPPFIKERYWYYKTKFQYHPKDIIAFTRRIQKWIDTGISMEININPDFVKINEVSDAILEGFKKGELKAVYYSLTIGKTEKQSGCTDCAN